MTRPVVTWRYDWAVIRRRANTDRDAHVRKFRLTADELATAAARFGIVADGEALPLNALHEAARDIIRTAYNAPDRGHAVARKREATDRMHEAVATWAGWMNAARLAQAAETQD